MVTAITRKENICPDAPKNHEITHEGIAWGRVGTSRLQNMQTLRQRFGSKENFPYALREFINSHIDLPTFDEIDIIPGKTPAFSNG